MNGGSNKNPFGVALAFTKVKYVLCYVLSPDYVNNFCKIGPQGIANSAQLWFGGTGDPHLQAAEEGLTEEYKSPKLAELQPWAVRQAEQSKYRTVGVYAGALGFSYNSEVMKKNGVPEPKCWADLANPIYRDEVQMANPNASGTAYATIATLVQIFGEDKAFELLKTAADSMARSEGTHALLKMNHADGGFDCPGCAWPDDLDGLHMDFCENGVKPLMWELTGKRVDRSFFERHTVNELSQWNDSALEFPPSCSVQC